MIDLNTAVAGGVSVNNTPINGATNDLPHLSGAPSSTNPGASINAQANSGIEGFGTVAPNVTDTGSSSAKQG